MVVLYRVNVTEISDYELYMYLGDNEWLSEVLKQDFMQAGNGNEEVANTNRASTMNGISS